MASARNSVNLPERSGALRPLGVRQPVDFLSPILLFLDAFHESHGSCSKESSVGLSLWVRFCNRVRVSWSTEDCVRELVDGNAMLPRSRHIVTNPCLAECIGDLALIENRQGVNRLQSRVRDAGYSST